jgi:hypothetical protein
VTLVPEQIVLSESEEVIETLGTKTVFTVVVIDKLVATKGEAHKELEVKTHETTSPLTKPLFE